MVEEKEVPNSRWFPLVLKWLGSPFAWFTAAAWNSQRNRDSSSAKILMHSHFCCFGTRFPLGQTCGSFASSFGIQSVDCCFFQVLFEILFNLPHKEKKARMKYFFREMVSSCCLCCFLFGNVGLVFHEVVKFHENHLCVQRDTEIYCPTAAAVKKKLVHHLHHHRHHRY